MELLRTTAPITLEEARSQIDALGSAAQKLEADLAVVKAELRQALTRENPAKWSQAMLSKSCYIAQADLEGARHAQETPPPTTRESPKTQQRKRHLNDATQDNEERTKATLFWQMIVRWRGRWMRLSGWGGLEESTNKEEELQNEEKTGYERLLLAKTSANIRRTARRLSSVSATLGGQGVGRKGKGKGG